MSEVVLVKKEAYFFYHDSNSRNDEKILSMRVKYGYEGYGLFWAIIEAMRDQTDYKLSTKKIKELNLSLNFDEKKLTDFIEDCINEFNLFSSDGDKFYSNRLLSNMKKKEQISRKRSAIAKQMQSNKKKEKESKVNKNILLIRSYPELCILKDDDVEVSKLFDLAWGIYPNKDGKKAAEKHFTASVKNGTDFDNLFKAIENYKNSENVKKGFIKSGSTFFNNWQDWITPVMNGTSKQSFIELEPEKL